MATVNIPGLCVYIKSGSGEGCHIVSLAHYEFLKDSLDRGERGWVELDSVYGDGKYFVALENIAELLLATPGYREAVKEDIRQSEIESS